MHLCVKRDIVGGDVITLGIVKTCLAWNFKKSRKSSEGVFLTAKLPVLTGGSRLGDVLGWELLVGWGPSAGNTRAATAASFVI